MCGMVGSGPEMRVVARVRPDEHEVAGSGPEVCVEARVGPDEHDVTKSGPTVCGVVGSELEVRVVAGAEPGSTWWSGLCRRIAGWEDMSLGVQGGRIRVGGARDGQQAQNSHQGEVGWIWEDLDGGTVWWCNGGGEQGQNRGLGVATGQKSGPGPWRERAAQAWAGGAGGRGQGMAARQRGDGWGGGVWQRSSVAVAGRG